MPGEVPDDGRGHPDDVAPALGVSGLADPAVERHRARGVDDDAALLPDRPALNILSAPSRRTLEEPIRSISTISR